MKLLNLTEGTVVLDDIVKPIRYTRNREVVEISDDLASTSRDLKFALATRMLLDVTNGIPAVLPEPVRAKPKQPQPPKVDIDPDSPWLQKQQILSKNDHGQHEVSKETGVMTPVSQEPFVRRRPAPSESCKKAFKETGAMSVVWTGPATDAGGYARMNRKFMFGLRDVGVNLKYDLLPSMGDMDVSIAKEISALQSVQVPNDAPKIYGMTAPLHYDWSRYKILFTMMETRRLHKDYVIRCNCADDIIVPTRWCEKVFRESGVTKPITVVPLGVDTTIYRPDVEPLSLAKKTKDFVFISVFGWSLRKGYDVLLKAYLEEFTDDDPVTLLISSRYFGSTDESKKQVIRNDINKIKAMVRNRKQPHLMLFGDVLSDAMMPRLYACADCYVLISRGEGFGLPMAEAAACKLPIISSRYSGHTDFLDDENSWLVDVDGFRSAEKDLSMISYFYEDAEFPTFGPAAVEQTRHFMREAFEKKEEGERKANKAYERVTSEYVWPVCVDKMFQKLKSVYPALVEGK